jgi:ubiquitin C-terminal hydrolase
MAAIPENSLVPSVQSCAQQAPQICEGAASQALIEKVTVQAKDSFSLIASSRSGAPKSLREWIWKKLGDLWNKITSCWRKRTSSPILINQPRGPLLPPTPPPYPPERKIRSPIPATRSLPAIEFPIQELQKSRMKMMNELTAVRSSIESLKGELYNDRSYSMTSWERDPHHSFEALKQIRDVYSHWENFICSFDLFKKNNGHAAEINEVTDHSQRIYSEFYECLLDHARVIHGSIFVMHENLRGILDPFRGQDGCLAEFPAGLTEENVSKLIEDYYDFYTILEQSGCKYGGVNSEELSALAYECLEILTNLELLKELQTYNVVIPPEGRKIIDPTLLSFAVNPVKDEISIEPQKLRGIPNLDCTCCYINSVLQMILNCQTLRKSTEVPIMDEPQSRVPNHKESLRIFLRRFIAAYDNDLNLRSFLWRFRKAVYESRLNYELDIADVIRDGRYQQQDAAAFLLCMMEILRVAPEQESIITKKTSLGDIECRTKVMDPLLKVHFTNDEDALDLQKHIDTICFGEEVLEGFKDDVTGSVIDAARKFRWKSLPESFVMQVVRNEYDPDTFLSYKSKKPVLWQGSLNLGMALENPSELVEGGDRSDKYELTSFTEHVNVSKDPKVKEALSEGHYKAYIKRRGCWYELNNEAVPSIKTEAEISVLKENMYLGVFEKIKELDAFGG